MFLTPAYCVGILTCGFCGYMYRDCIPSLKKCCKFDKVYSAVNNGDKYDKYEKQLNRKLSKATDLVRMMRF